MPFCKCVSVCGTPGGRTAANRTVILTSGYLDANLFLFGSGLHNGYTKFMCEPGQDNDFNCIGEKTANPYL